MPDGLLTMAGRVSVPVAVRDAVRKALATGPTETPDVAYRLAAGWAHPGDREAIALFCLDNGEQFQPNRCTVTAGLRGGSAGMRWAMTAALTGIVDPVLIEQRLTETVRHDQQTLPAIAAMISSSWDRMIDHSGRKARMRLNRSSEGRRMEFVGWPNPEAARRAGVDELVDGAWDSFVTSLTTLFAAYTRTQRALVATVDPDAADVVAHAIEGRVATIVNSLVAFLDLRARQFVTGEVPFRPADFDIARVVTGWLSGANNGASGFTVDELANAQFPTGITTAQAALMGLIASRLTRMFTWAHSYYGVPLTPFEPHLALDGQTFTESEFGLLHEQPGSHVGCLCEIVPSWTMA